MLQFCGFVVESGRRNGDQRDKKRIEETENVTVVFKGCRDGLGGIFWWARVCNCWSDIQEYFR
jgi:hypothetical protein